MEMNINFSLFIFRKWIYQLKWDLIITYQKFCHQLFRELSPAFFLCSSAFERNSGIRLGALPHRSSRLQVYLVWTTSISLKTKSLLFFITTTVPACLLSFDKNYTLRRSKPKLRKSTLLFSLSNLRNSVSNF